MLAPRLLIFPSGTMHAESRRSRRRMHRLKTWLCMTFRWEQQVQKRFRWTVFICHPSMPVRPFALLGRSAMLEWRISLFQSRICPTWARQGKSTIVSSPHSQRHCCMWQIWCSCYHHCNIITSWWTLPKLTCHCEVFMQLNMSPLSNCVWRHWDFQWGMSVRWSKVSKPNKGNSTMLQHHLCSKLTLINVTVRPLLPLSNSRLCVASGGLLHGRWVTF